jgi:hypothetical protein
MTQPHRTRCGATNKQTGEPCGNWAIKGGTVCRYHGGAAPQVKAAAARRWEARLAEMVDPALERLEALSMGADSDAVKLRATDSILDRGGVRVDSGEHLDVEVVIRWPE